MTEELRGDGQENLCVLYAYAQIIFSFSSPHLEWERAWCVCADLEYDMMRLEVDEKGDSARPNACEMHTWESYLLA